MYILKLKSLSDCNEETQNTKMLFCKNKQDASNNHIRFHQFSPSLLSIKVKYKAYK